MRRFSMIAMWAALGSGLLFGAPAAHAVEIETFHVHQFIAVGKPQIHVKFDLQADNWNAATEDLFKVRFDASVTLRKVTPVLDGSDLTVSFDKFKKVIDLSDYGVAYHGQSYEFTINFAKPASALGDLKNEAVNVCREIHSNGGKPSKSYVIPKLGTAFADILVRVASQAASVKVDQVSPPVAYEIVCDANPKWHEPVKPIGGIATDKGPFRVESVSLFLATIVGQETHPTPNMSCSKVKVTVRIETNGTGVVSYKLWRQPGNAVTKEHIAAMQTEGPYKGRFIVEDTFWDSFGKTTYQQYMVEMITGSPFGKSTQWKPISIKCNGNYASPTPDEPVPTFKVTSMDLQIIGTDADGCPAKATVSATFIANMPGKFDYLIGTSLGPNKHGVLEAKKVGNVYSAQQTLDLDVTESGELKVHAIALDFPNSAAEAAKAYDCAGPEEPLQGYHAH